MKKLACTTWGADTITLRIRSEKYRTRHPASSQGPWSQCRELSRKQSQGFRHLRITGATNCFLSLPKSKGCKTTLWSRDCPSQQRGDWRWGVSFTWAGYLNSGIIISLTMTPNRSLGVMPFLLWERELLLSFSVQFPVLARNTPKVAQRESPSLWNTFRPTTPKNPGLMVYTDSFAEKAIRKGGAGVYILCPGCREARISLAIDLYHTNHKAGAEAMKTAAAHVKVSTHASHNVVIPTDALSILHALWLNRTTDHNNLSSASFCKSQAVTLQRISFRCIVPSAMRFLPRQWGCWLSGKGSTTEKQVDWSTPTLQQGWPLLPVIQAGASNCSGLGQITASLTTAYALNSALVIQSSDLVVSHKADPDLPSCVTDCPRCGRLCLGASILPCGHLVCKRCLRFLLEEDDSQGFTCPTCGGQVDRQAKGPRSQRLETFPADAVMQCLVDEKLTASLTTTYALNSALVIQSSGLVVLAVSQQNICNSAPPLWAALQGNLARPHMSQILFAA